MNKTLKKVLIFVLLLVLVVLIIFVIQILMPKNNSGEPGKVSPSSSAALTPSPSPSPSLPPSPSPSPSAALSPSPSDAGTVTTEQTASGTKYSVVAPGGAVSYTVTADSGVMTYTRDKGGELFSSNKNKNAYVKITYLPGAKSSSTAPGFLDAYINYTEFEQSGQNFIDGTKISGETVAANDGKTQVTAWLVDTNGGVLAVAMSYSLSNKSAELPELQKLLSTLTVKA